MHASSEIPLLFFTLLAQMAVGILLAGQAALAGNGAAPIRGRLENQSFIAFVFIGAAALISVFHLGTPLHAPFTLLHVGSSWLSREIIMVLLMAACLGALVWLRWRRPDSRMIRGLTMLACALGVVLIYAMSKVYNSPFLPGWEGASTFFLFLASALILGAFWQACVLGTASLKDGFGAERAPLWRIFLLALAGFVLLAAFLPWSMPEAVMGMNPLSRGADQESVAMLQGWHALLSGLGVILFLGALWRAMRNKPVAAILIAGLLLAIGGEIAGRFAFYMSYARLGM